MRPGNRPKSNTGSRLTPNGGGPEGELLGSAPARNETGPPAASRPAFREFFAPGTPASAAADPGGSAGPPADIDELAATLGRLSCVAGAVAVELASAAPAAGVDTEAGTAAAGPDIEPGAHQARRGRRRVGRRVDVPADVARANPSTPPPAGTATTRR